MAQAAPWRLFFLVGRIASVCQERISHVPHAYGPHPLPANAYADIAAVAGTSFSLVYTRIFPSPPALHSMLSPALAHTAPGPPPNATCWTPSSPRLRCSDHSCRHVRVSRSQILTEQSAPDEANCVEVDASRASEVTEPECAGIAWVCVPGTHGNVSGAAGMEEDMRDPPSSMSNMRIMPSSYAATSTSKVGWQMIALTAVGSPGKHAVRASVRLVPARESTPRTTVHRWLITRNFFPALELKRLDDAGGVPDEDVAQLRRLRRDADWHGQVRRSGTFVPALFPLVRLVSPARAERRFAPLLRRRIPHLDRPVRTGAHKPPLGVLFARDERKRPDRVRVPDQARARRARVVCRIRIGRRGRTIPHANRAVERGRVELAPREGRDDGSHARGVPAEGGLRLLLRVVGGTPVCGRVSVRRNAPSMLAATHFPLSRFATSRRQYLTVQSVEPDTTEPSGPNAIALTESRWLTGAYIS